MDKRKIDLSGIKENDLDKTASFTDLMTRAERKNRKSENQIGLQNDRKTTDDIEDMIDEKKKTTKDLKEVLETARHEYKNEKEKFKEEELGKTQILDITRKMKFNFEETKKENIVNKKKGVSVLNIIGEINLLCIGYYIYLLIFTNYQDNKLSYIITGSIIVLLVLLFGLSVITKKKLSKFFNILNILAIIAFIAFNIYTFVK